MINKKNERDKISIFRERCNIVELSEPTARNPLDPSADSRFEQARRARLYCTERTGRYRTPKRQVKADPTCNCHIECIIERIGDPKWNHQMTKR
jgi:hypothetical protein